MLTLLLTILLVVAGTVISYRLTCKFDLCDELIGLVVFISLAIAFAVGIFGGINIERNIYNKAEKVQVIETIDKLEALSDSSSSKTYIRTYGSKDSYVFRYLVNGKFGKQVKEIKNNSNTYIIETNEKEPSIISCEYKLNNGFLSFLVSESLFDKEERTEIIVPEETISEGFEIDLQ